MRASLTALLLAAVSLVHTGASEAPAAATPPMGWNSWDSYGSSVTEAEVRAQADYMAQHLKAHGWRYVVVDIQWSEPNPEAHAYRPGTTLTMDDNGRLLPAENRFPSAAGGKGFKPLADYVHGLGLSFGIHIMRGIPRRAVDANLPVAGSTVRAADIADRFSVCPWNDDMYGVDMTKPRAQDYYDSIVSMYAGWGVDFIKADDIARPTHGAEIQALHAAILKTGRPIVLSLSPGPAMAKDIGLLQENANMWRISDDFWDDWKALRLNFILLSIWSGMGRPGAWPDADMLPLGRMALRAHNGGERMTRFTRDEQRTMLSLWSIAQSPLILGGDLPSTDPWTLSLLTNDEVLAVDQQGRGGGAIAEGGPAIVWAADAPAGAKFVALFNVGDDAREVGVTWGALGLPGKCAVRDLWDRRDVGVLERGYSIRLPAHGSALLRVVGIG